MSRISRYCVAGLLCLASLVASSTWAATTDRYVVERNGVRLEISAPRADIVRIRAGQAGLPEDASWAVAPDIRGQLTLLDVTDTRSGAEIRTGQMTVKVDSLTLGVSILDRDGNALLADAAGGGLEFERGGFKLRKQMPVGEHYFGLGDKTGPLDRRDGAFTLWNTDAYGFPTNGDPIYKSIPFVLAVNEAGRAWGMFMDNTWRSYFDFGKSERDTLAIGAEGGPVDYYIMAGPEPKNVVEDFAYLTGKAPLMPMWALGFQQSHYSYMSETETLGIADRLRADKIPTDALYLDIDYQDRNRPFSVNATAFPDMAGLTKKLRDRDLRLIVITDLHVAYAPGEGYAPYDSGAAQDIFLKNPDGTTYVGPVWPGPAVFPDFSRPKAREWWGTQYAEFSKDNVAGFWNDMNEPAIFDTPTKTMPLDTVHRIEEPGFAPRDATHAELHNVFGLLNARATYDGLRKLKPDERPFVLTRAAYPGAQKYAATWTGDNTSSWAHLSLSVSQLVNLGLSGFSYAGDDIGGFTGDAPSPDLLTRWIEVGAFNPIFRDHYGKGRPPQEVWVHGPDQEAIRRRYIEERYRLMPYIYQLAEETSRTGLPMMRPVFLEYPKSAANAAANVQFMLGDDLLIAPPTTWESPADYSIALPGEGWYDYWTGNRMTKTAAKETPKLERLPVFVRPGAIFAKQPLVQSTMQTPSGPLEVHVWPGENCQGELYFDDGETYAYTRGVYLRQALTCTSDAKGTTVSFAKREGTWTPWWTSVRVVVHGWRGAARVAMTGGKALTVSVDNDGGTLSVDLPDVAKATKLTMMPGT